MKNLKEARVFVSTYAKYSNGSSYGKWLDLSDYADKDEFLDACRKLHKDESDPEFMFQDWENIPEVLISEYEISETVFDLINKTENMPDTDMEAFTIWMEHYEYDIEKLDVYDILNRFYDGYCGEYDSEEDFAYDIVETCYDLSEFAKTYFDYDAFARDLFIQDYWMEDGFVFRIA